MVVAPSHIKRLILIRRPTLVVASMLAGLGAAALLYSLTLHAPCPAVPAAAHTASSPAEQAATQTAAARPPASPSGPAAVPGESATGTAATASQGPQIDGGVSSAALQHALDASSPADLPAATASKVIGLARAGLSRDLAAGAAADGLEIQAAIARRHGGRSDLIDVTLLYTDQDPANLEPEHMAVLTYALTSAGWVPVIGQAGVSEP